MRALLQLGVLVALAATFASATAAFAQGSPTFYSYETKSGRTVYVNRFSLVPPEKRSQARAIDLSEVELHEELAVNLADAVEDELRLLKESDPCHEARKEEIAGTWSHLMNRHGGWILACFGALVLLLMTPWMVARTPPGAWSRFLMVAFPALAMTALVSVSATRATSSLEAVSELVKLCDANEKEASPRTQVIRLNEMHTYIEQLYKEQYEQIEELSQIK
jgi:hypothetical protein